MEFQKYDYSKGNPNAPPKELDLSPLGPESQIARAHFAKKRVQSTHTIADICCGSSYLSDILDFGHYIGVDHPEIIEKVEARSVSFPAKISYKRFDCEGREDLKLDEKVDRVVSFETIEHVMDPGRFLWNIRRNIKEDGMLILSTPNNPRGKKPKYIDHFKEYSLEEMKALLKSQKFSIEGEYVMGVPLGLLAHLAERGGMKTHRMDPETESRGRLSKALDYLPIVRKCANIILPYHLGYSGFGDSGLTMVLTARARP